MTDSEIIKLILQGDKEKFRMLVEQYQQMVFRTCVGFLHNKDDADDLTQDVFIRLFNHCPDLKAIQLFLPGSTGLQSTRHLISSGSLH